MRPISPDLLAKLNSNMQTPANNAQPRMSVQVSRARSAVVDSTYWTVETIRTKTGLGDISIAPRRQRPHGRPDRVYEIHVDSGIVRTTIREYPDLLEGGWQHQFDIGPGKAVAMAFDGEWHLWRKKWRLQTAEKPWIMWVTDTNVLYAQHWDDETTRVELATGVLKVRAMRGWKNKYYPERDQGIVVGYIKSDGFLYYRSYCQDVYGAQAWEMERKVNEINFQITNLNLFLLNDFRMGFVVQNTSNQIYWLISQRNWAGMAIGIETLAAAPFNAKVEYDYIDYLDAMHTETIFGAISEVSARLLWAVPYNAILSAENEPNTGDNWGYSIVVEFEHGITTPNPNDFSLTDENSALFQVLGITHISGNVYTLQTSDFNNAYGNLSVNFTGGGITKGENEQDMISFSLAFLPTNLSPTFIPVPEVEGVWNE